MNVIGAHRSGASRLERVEDAEDQERGHALRGRRQVVNRAERVRERKRCRELCAMAREVARCKRAPDGGEVARDRLRKPAAVKVIETGAGETAERLREPRLPENAASGRHAPPRQVRVSEAGLCVELAAPGGGHG
jgi:hypothetical protein